MPPMQGKRVLLGVTGGELAVFDEPTQQLVIVASHNLGRASIGTRMAMGEGAMGHAALAREPPSARERAALHADLAGASRATGRSDEAAAHARAARALATRIGSRRVLRTLDGQGFSAGRDASSS